MQRRESGGCAGLSVDRCESIGPRNANTASRLFEINVSLTVWIWRAGRNTELIARFHRRHEELYTYSIPDQEVVMVNARVTVIGELPEMRKERPSPPGRKHAPARPRRQRRVYLDRWLQMPIFDLAALTPGETVYGPAIIEAPTTTVLLRRNERAGVTPLGWLDIQVALR
jgi:N-methylhydantoinase A